jgi:hypothetical protein
MTVTVEKIGLGGTANDLDMTPDLEVHCHHHTNPTHVFAIRQVSRFLSDFSVQIAELELA